MPNMSLKKNEMPVQDANVRNKNFQEVALGYTEEQALDEAERCLNCKNKPCVTFPHLSQRYAKRISRVLIRSLQRAARCPQSADASALRKRSARASAFAV